jgi:alpha-galactosidase
MQPLLFTRAGPRVNLMNLDVLCVSSLSLHARIKCCPIRFGYGVPGRALSIVLQVLILVSIAIASTRGFAADTGVQQSLADLPPMGWNDWAHYRCGYTAQDIVANARALVAAGLAAKGYSTVTIDDCWMQKTRDADGNLQADPQRFPQGIKPVADAVHALGLKFGIYEDAGYKTCGGFAGSGVPDGGGSDHFREDARLFASWGVDYLKLDGCNVYVPRGASNVAVFQNAYAAESAALKAVGWPIVFSESAPAYFLDTPDWYDALTWVREYGQLWREGWDTANFHPEEPEAPRFHAVLWNYAYNLPLGRFQKPGNWDDPDFIIGGDHGMTLAETRSQMALWSMMSAPLILSSDVSSLSPQAVAILGNANVIAVDQDAQGKMATLVRRTPVMDVLFKPLTGGDYAIAVLNRGEIPLQVNLSPAAFGFRASADCRFDAQDLWSGSGRTVSALEAEIASHDTGIWRVRPAGGCGLPARIGAITLIVTPSKHDIDSYSRCLAASGSVGSCAGAPVESWTVTAEGALQSGGLCLENSSGGPKMQVCSGVISQCWNYGLQGNLVNDADRRCLSATDINGKPHSLEMQACGHNDANQIWSLPN